MRYGFVAEAQRVARGLVDAAAAFAGRLPELFCGFDRTEFEQPVPYPTSCSPQAWAAASPLLLLRSLLRLDPDLPRHRVGLAPRLLPELGAVHLDNVPLGTGRVGLTVDGDAVDVTGLPSGVEIESTPRHPTGPRAGAA
jgi:glycogen debranching enzyme